MDFFHRIDGSQTLLKAPVTPFYNLYILLHNTIKCQQKLYILNENNIQLRLKLKKQTEQNHDPHRHDQILHPPRPPLALKRLL